MSEYKRLTYKLDEPIKTKYLDYKYMKIADYDIDRGNFGRITDDMLYNKLGELEDKIENGTLIELPCKVGDTVWYIKSYGFGRYQVEDTEVAGFNFSKYENAIWVVGKYEEQLSKIYKTREEAEKRLNEIQNGSANY